jgi:hypothetical protein
MEIEKYLFQNKLLLYRKKELECAVLKANGMLSNIHVKIYLDKINVIGLEKGLIKLRHEGEIYYYWCDTDIFAKLYCKNISEIRNEIIDSLL